MEQKAGEIEQVICSEPMVDTSHTAVAEEGLGEMESSKFGKFNSLENLLSAYNSLESEFTRRCQKVKELERENEKLKVADKPKTESDSQSVSKGKKAFKDYYPEAEDFASKLYEIAAKSNDEAEGFLERAYVSYLKNQIIEKEKYFSSKEYLASKIDDNLDIKDGIIREYLKSVNDSKPQTRHYLGNGESVIAPPSRPKTLTEANKIARQIFEKSKEIN